MTNATRIAACVFVIKAAVDSNKNKTVFISESQSSEKVSISKRKEVLISSAANPDDNTLC